MWLVRYRYETSRKLLKNKKKEEKLASERWLIE